MDITKYGEMCDDAIEKGETLVGMMSYDGKKACVLCAEESVNMATEQAAEQHISLEAYGEDLDINGYYCIFFNRYMAEWRCICPPDYKNIDDPQQRVAQYYKDGCTGLSAFLAELGYFPNLIIPKQYRQNLYAAKPEDTSKNTQAIAMPENALRRAFENLLRRIK